MQTLNQSPTDPGFAQNPYPFYERARETGPLFHWQDYDLVCAVSNAAVAAALRDRRFGRAAPDELKPEIPARLAPFYDIEAHSMLELEPPRHTRLRGQVLRAFTSRRIAALEPEISVLCEQLLDRCSSDFDLIQAYAKPIPVIVIARLLGVPEEMADQLLAWSNAMVAMYQARRTTRIEDAAMAASTAFTDYLRGHIRDKRRTPGDDLLSEMLAAREPLSEAELISTSILLLNAGHEATVHTIGNGVKALIESGPEAGVLEPAAIADCVEEVLRYDPPLHMFTRWAYEDIEIAGHTFRRGERIGLLLAAANRDPGTWGDPGLFDPFRAPKPHNSFGAGIHFCVGAPLARMELKIALPALFRRFPGLKIAETPRYADLYHFHGLEKLLVRT